MLLSAWPPKLDEAQLASLSHQATDYALSHSILYRPLPSSHSLPPHDSAIHAPISLFPTPFPRILFARSQALQPIYNDLYARVTVDEDFLQSVIGGSVIKVDDFQAGLWNVWCKVQEEGVVQPLHLGLFRSDYLLHHHQNKEELSIKQVELNTISSSFGPLCTKVSQLHRHLALSSCYYNTSPLVAHADDIPKNEALVTLAEGLAAGHQAYVESPSRPDKSSQPVILFVVQEGERNVFDQRLIEFELLEKHKIKVERATFAQLSTSAELVGPNRVLQVDFAHHNPKRLEVSVVYYRSAYSPHDYTHPQAWETRLLLERSLAIKCPTVALQLAGAKKVQQVLCEPGMVERFLQDEKRGKKKYEKEEIEMLKGSFMDMYPLDDSPRGKEGVQLAMEKWEEFVMKPQREGGGNNVYRGEIPTQLQIMEEREREKGKGRSKKGGRGEEKVIKEREGYILMRLIQPPVGIGNYLLRAGNEKGEAALATDVISELGAFGTILFQGGGAKEGERMVDIKFEKSGGHLLRTKGRESDEGGVAVGYSVIDSPVLV